MEPQSEFDQLCTICGELYQHLHELESHEYQQHLEVMKMRNDYKEGDLRKPYKCTIEWCKDRFSSFTIRDKHSSSHCYGQCTKKSCQVFHSQNKPWLCNDLKMKENKKNKIYPSKFFKTSNIVILRKGKAKCFVRKEDPFEIFCLKCRTWTNDLSELSFIHFDCEQINFIEKTPLNLDYLIFHQKKYNVFCFDCQKSVSNVMVNPVRKVISHTCYPGRNGHGGTHQE